MANIIIPTKTKEKINDSIAKKFKTYNGSIEQLVKVLFVEMAKLSIHDEINGIQFKVSSLMIEDKLVYIIDYQVGHFRSTKYEVVANILSALGLSIATTAGLTSGFSFKLSNGGLVPAVSALTIIGARSALNILSDLRYTKFSYVYAPHLKKVAPNIHNFVGTTRLKQFDEYNKHTALKAMEFAINKSMPVILKTNNQDIIDSAIFGSLGLTLQKGIGNNISIASVIDTKTNTVAITFKLSYTDNAVFLLFKTSDPANVAKGIVFINRDSKEVVWKI